MFPGESINSYDYFPFTKIKPRSQTSSFLPYSSNVILLKCFISRKMFLFVFNPERLPSLTYTQFHFSVHFWFSRHNGEFWSSRALSISDPKQLRIKTPVNLCLLPLHGWKRAVPRSGFPFLRLPVPGSQCQRPPTAPLLQTPFILTSTPRILCFQTALQREYVTTCTYSGQDSHLLEKRASNWNHAQKWEQRLLMAREGLLWYSVLFVTFRVLEKSFP